jgi:Cys-tRNA synthase (O-phospho-L-seryl-tRNA:Cys-tRNA synthase)
MSMKEQQKEFLINFLQNQFRHFLNNFENEFISWEHFLKHGMLLKYIKQTQQEFQHAFSNLDKNSNLNLDKIKHNPLNEEEEHNLFKFLGLTHMQFKELYQKGVVLI